MLLFGSLSIDPSTFAAKMMAARTVRTVKYCMLKKEEQFDILGFYIELYALSRYAPKTEYISKILKYVLDLVLEERMTFKTRIQDDSR